MLTGTDQPGVTPGSPSAMGGQRVAGHRVPNGGCVGGAARELRLGTEASSPTNSPHPTLATSGELTASIRWELAEVAAALPVRVRFTGVVRFERPTSVLAWGLDLDSALAGLHRRVWEAVVSDSPPGTLSPFHTPGCWSPHVTLGRTRRAGAFADRRVLELLPAPPLSVWLTTLRSYDTRTGELEVLKPGPETAPAPAPSYVDTDAAADRHRVAVTPCGISRRVPTVKKPVFCCGYGVR
ncbi:2'-5' RNA ligase family protein [Streptomyces sp. NPDC007905]|uniref:2'-5' RNA ligase family protein n=1 Tax=Streptomyces sp. NPDC007905 TaxID=3364788 RepID=UPI0036DFFD7F